MFTRVFGCAHVHTRVWVCTSVWMHGSGGVAPQPCPPTLKPREGNRQFSCGCNPCMYNAREGIIPGINILNSLTRPTDSKILRPVIILLSLGLPRSWLQTWVSGEVGESCPPTLAHPKLPRAGAGAAAFGFFSFSLAILSVSPAVAGRRLFLVACLLLIPSNLSRIKTPLRKNGPGPNTCYANGSKSSGPPRRGGGDLRAAGGPGASSSGRRTPSPELGRGTPKAPPNAQAQFHPTITVLQFFQVIFIGVKRK